MLKKNFIPISIGFCVIPLQNYRETFKKYRKRAITRLKFVYEKLIKGFWDRYIRNVIYQCQNSTGYNKPERQSETQTAIQKIWALGQNFLPWTLLFMCKKNFIAISICFCVIALQIYREILKKYRKRAITLEKNNFSKIWENHF